MPPFHRPSLLAGAAAALAGCAHAPAGPAAPEPRALVERYVDATFEEEPSLPRSLGLHAFDGRVAELDEAAVARRRARAGAHLAAVDALPLGELPDPLRLDLQLTRLHAERTLFEIDALDAHRKIVSYLGLFDVSPYLNRAYAPLGERTGALAAHVEAAAARVPTMLALLAPVQPRTHLETARLAYRGMVEYFETDVLTLTQPARASDPALEARFQTAYAGGLAALREVLAWIEARLPEATEDFALGPERLLRMLEVNEGLRTTLPELERRAEESWRRNHAAYVETARRIDPTKGPAEVAAQLLAEHLPADRVLDVARGHLDELLAFVEAKEILTIGSEDRAQVAVTPPFMRWNSAFLDSAGPFETAKESYYYITPPDPSWPREKQLSYLPWEGDLLSTSIHEVYPGHFVQGLQLLRAPTRAQKVFASYAFVEGWAHYAEEMMFEAGLAPGDAKRRLGMLSNALLRNCRFLATLGLHTKGMTVPEAQRLFEEKCFIDPGNAEQQAYRGTFDPGYLSYTLGKIQIFELRERFFAARGTRSLRAFHDWLLSFGNAPITLIAERL